MMPGDMPFKAEGPREMLPEIQRDNIVRKPMSQDMFLNKVKLAMTK